MQIRPSLPSSRLNFSARMGWTLVEMLVAVGTGTIILGAVVVTTLSMNSSLIAISNYFQLDVNSRSTLDQMSRDIRNANSLTSFATNAISMSGVNYQGTPFSFTYEWDGTNMWRMFTTNHTTTTTLMLSNCTYLSFDNYSRVPESNFLFYAAGTNRTKLINVTWKCSRSILGVQRNTESIQTAQVVIRN